MEVYSEDGNFGIKAKQRDRDQRCTDRTEREEMGEMWCGATTATPKKRVTENSQSMIIRSTKQEGEEKEMIHPSLTRASCVLIPAFFCRYHTNLKHERC